MNKYNNLNIAYLGLSEKLSSRHAGAIHVGEIVKGFKKFKNKVHLYCEENNKHYNYVHYVKLPIGFKEILLLNIIKAFKSLKEILRDFEHYKPDIIYERWHHPDIFSYIIARKTKVPRMLEVNSPITEEIHSYPILSIISKLFRKIQFDQSSAIITQTKTLAKLLRTMTNTPVYIVPNGVSTDMFTDKLEFPLIYNNIPNIDKKIKVTFVGSFKQWHGVEQIPLIAKKIIEKHNNVIFILVGSGELLSNVLNIIPNHLKKDIILTGAQPYEEIPKYLANSDILIAPFNAANYKAFKKYHFWWCPIKLYEYMSSGKPIVSYDYLEVKEIIGNHNLLAKIGNKNDFIDKLDSLINNKSLRIKIGKQNRLIAIKEYTWSKRVKQTLKVIHSVLNKEKHLIYND
ncbi:glycosyltransferase family 1 protein [Candidatus Microgenomates bacterium]|nr:MAG: glycosyltransferase family 1 protein [Candidatus Microgenomates bacterium]